MPQNWKTYKLEDLSERVTVGFVGSMAQEYIDEGVPMLRSQNIKPFKLDFDNLKFISKEFHQKIIKSSLKENDVAIIRTGNPGIATVIPRGLDSINCSDLVLVTPDVKKINPHFLCYYFNSIASGYVNSQLVGAVQQHFNVGSAKKMEISLPSIMYQAEIVDIVKSINDKIELNLQQNKILEEMAMTLYKHWFVDFEFPSGAIAEDGSDIGYKTAGGEFVESELGMIPKGWEVKKLKDFAELTMGQSPKSEFYNHTKEGLPFHQGVKDYGVRFPTDVTYTTSGNRIAEDGDILFSVRAPVGRLNIAKNKIVLGRGLATIKMNENNGFMFYALKTMFISEDIIGSGTVFNSVNKIELQNLKFVLPENDILKQFKELIEPIDDQYSCNSRENKTLTTLRDSLLPKLISGEVRVKDVEELIKL